MRYFVQWIDKAFRELERFPQQVAFNVIRQTDLLSEFQEMGPDLGSRFPELIGLRQLIIGGNLRVIYEVDNNKGVVWLLSIQSCLRKLPSANSLKRRKPKYDR